MLTEKIGSNIRHYREMSNLTQKYVAKSLEISDSQYSKIERGEAEISLRLLENSAGILRTTPYHLLSFDRSIYFNHENQQKTHHINAVYYQHQSEELKSSVDKLRWELDELKKKI